MFRTEWLPLDQLTQGLKPEARVQLLADQYPGTKARDIERPIETIEAELASARELLGRRLRKFRFFAPLVYGAGGLMVPIGIGAVVIWGVRRASRGDCAIVGLVRFLLGVSVLIQGVGIFGIMPRTTSELTAGTLLLLLSLSLNAISLILTHDLDDVCDTVRVLEDALAVKAMEDATVASLGHQREDPV
ncbi:MAG: hypothetical protein JNK85_25360 [Verrucomicrobiales bacterium]|nr:hypothetical protein [Verrucomicrobiales bacterium]